MAGLSAETTEKQLAEMGVKSYKGQRFSNSSIRQILSNITYTGNLLFQKEYISDPITGKSRKNYGELPQYFVENTHEAIIPMEIYKAVQDERMRRRELGVFANWSINTSYGCGTQKKKGSKCPARDIREDVLRAKCAEVLGLAEFDEEVFSVRVEKIVVPEHGILEFHMTDGQIICTEWKSTAKKDCWTEERRAAKGRYVQEHQLGVNSSCFTSRIHCDVCGENYRRQSHSHKDGSDATFWRCASSTKCDSVSIKEETLKGLCAEAMGLAEFNESAFREQISCIRITAPFQLSIYFLDGHTFEGAWENKWHGTKHTEEYKEHMRQLMTERWTPERKAEMSERVKKIRSEKYWSSKRK